VETELHFLTTCHLYQDIRDTYFPQISNTQKNFENLTNNPKLPYLPIKLFKLKERERERERCIQRGSSPHKHTHTRYYVEVTDCVVD